MATKKYEGESLTYIATEDLIAGDFVVLGVSLGVAVNTVKTGEKTTILMEGVFEDTATTADKISQGSVLYWDVTAKELTVVEGTNIRAGTAWTNKAAGAAGVAEVRIG